METRSRSAAWLVPLALVLAALAPRPAAQEGGQELSEEELQAALRGFEESLDWRTGEVPLGEGLARLTLPEDLRYLGPADTRRVLEDLWGNPHGDGTLGMLFPADAGPLDDGWAVVLSFDEQGFIEDDDAAELDYDELLASMKEGTRAESRERQEAGFESIELVGWATRPHYDAQAKKLYWAKELSFGGSPEHTLNYDIRILGRRGVLVLDAVAGMDQLAEVEAHTPELLAAVAFEPGHRYSDFDPSVDKVAALGIGALIAGKLAVKAGLFKGLLALLVAGKKFVILGVAAAAAGLRKLVRRRPAS